MHAAAEDNFRQKIDTHDDLSAEDFRQLTAAAFEEQERDGFTLTAAESKRGRAAVLGEAKDRAIALGAAHRKKVAVLYQPVFVEQTVRIELPNSTRDLITVIDLVDDERRVVDFKHSAKRWKAEDAHHSTQLTINAAGYRVLSGNEPSELRYEVLSTWGNFPRTLLKTHRQAEDYEALANRIGTMLHVIEAGYFPPANPTAWWCSPSYCGYWATCPYVNGLRRKE